MTNPDLTPERFPAAEAPSYSFNTPPEEDFTGRSMQGSLQEILADNLGEYVVIEFLMGTQITVKKEGILYFVGSSYVVLYDEISGRYVVCDLFSIKFVTFYQPGIRPRG